MVIVASLLQIIDQVDSLDSSRDLQPIHAKNFVNTLHLVLHTCVETFDVIFFLYLRGLWVVTKQGLYKNNTHVSRKKNSHRMFRHMYGVLNEIYLQNFLHGWAVNRETNLISLPNP